MIKIFGGIIAGITLVLVMGSTSASASDPFAGATAREYAFRPLASMVRKVGYFRNGDLMGERIFYRNGKVAQESPFKNGKIEGVTRRYYKSGKLFCELPYHNGKLNGTARFYKENGELLGKSKLKNGTGVLRQYPLFSMAIPDQEIPYKNGLVDGPEYEWYHTKHGVQCEIIQYAAGIMDGWGFLYDEKGRLIQSSYIHAASDFRVGK